MRTVLVIASLISIIVSPLQAEEIKPVQPEGLSIERYRAQLNLYQFLTNDYLPLWESAGRNATTPKIERDRISFLLGLTDTQLLPFEARKGISPDGLQLETRSLSILRAIAYQREKFEQSLLLGEMLSGTDGALYKKGMTLLNLKWLKDAESVLEKVPPEDAYFPYAMIALAQIEVKKGKINNAENLIRRVLLPQQDKRLPADGKVRLAERLNLLLGQILYEKKSYPEALAEFARIPAASPFYQEALIGQAWCHIYMKDYDKAIDILKDVKLSSFPDADEQEVLMTLGYCWIKSGNMPKAKKYFEELLATVTFLENRLSQSIEDKPLRKKYISYLFDEGGDALSEGERVYLPFLQRDRTLERLLKATDYLHELKDGFISLRKEIAGYEAYLNNVKEGLSAVESGIEKDIERLKKVIINSRFHPYLRAGKTAEGGGTGDHYSNLIFEEWRKTLNRDFTPETRTLIKLILDEWSKDDLSRCYGNPILCYVASSVKPEKGQFTPSQVRNIALILDAIARDLKNIKSGKNIFFEDMLEGERKKIAERISGNNEKMSKLVTAREEIDRNISRIEKDMEANRNNIESQILLALIKERYDLGNMKARITEELGKIKIPEQTGNKQVKSQ